jgi:hypothetical protein
MEINIFNYEGSDGSQKFEAAFNELGYLNATEAYQFFGKASNAFAYFKTNTLVPYAEKLITLGKVPYSGNSSTADNQVVTVDDLILIVQGGTPHEQGTWLHPKLAIVFARWISLEFEIWCDEKINELLANGTVTLLEEDKKWVEYVDSMFDVKPGSKAYMDKLYKALLIHEQEGYNIKAFKDIIEVIRQETEKELQAKVFKKLRKLIKEMYEKRELSRTTHEAMLELCVDTVVEVLEKQLRSEKSKLRRFALKAPAPVIETALPTATPTAPPTAPSVAELAAAAKKEHDATVRQNVSMVDARFLTCHKHFGLSNKATTDEILIFKFGKNCSVVDCKNMMKDAGYKVSFSNVLYEKPRDAVDGYPDLKFKDPTTHTAIAFWFNDADGSMSCEIQRSLRDSDGNWANLLLSKIKLKSDPSLDPQFFTGSNPENTLRVILSTRLPYFMVYGRPADEK